MQTAYADKAGVAAPPLLRENIPQELKNLPRWVCWRYEKPTDQGKKWRKVPYDAKTVGANASSTDPATWATFNEALNAYDEAQEHDERPYSGIGFCLDDSDRLAGGDLDNCVTNGVISKEALRLLERIKPAYVEYSPSGNGVRFFGYSEWEGSASGELNGCEVELYGRKGRYLTVTGKVALGKPSAPLQELHDMAAVAAEVKRQKEGPNSAAVNVIDYSHVATPQRLAELRSALGAIRADDYGTWVSMGHALKTLGEAGRALWIEWSQTSVKWRPSDAGRWDGFTPKATSYEAVFAEAQRAGWLNPASNAAKTAQNVPDSDGVLSDEPLLQPVSVIDVLTRPSPAPRFVWEGYIPCGVVTLFSAHGGTGKSYVALMLAVATAVGRPLFGKTTEQCPVVFASLEDGAGIVRYRLATICKAWDIAPEALHGCLHIVDGTEYPELFAADGRGPGDATAAYHELRKLAQTTSAGLVIVDNASDAYGGDEIQRRQVRAFMRILARIARDQDAGVMLLAHVDKTTSRARKSEGGEGYSGSTAWHNSARSRLFMVRNDDGTLTLNHEKGNHAKGLQEPITLTWPKDGLPDTVQSLPPEVVQRLQGRADDQAAITLLRLVAEYADRSQYMGTALTARNNPHATLKADPTFKRLRLNREDVQRIVTQCQRAGWLAIEEYRTPDRKNRDRWTVTPEGRDFADIAPSAPSAPSMDESADGAESAGGAPSAPSCVGGTGESARAQEGADLAALADCE